VKKSAFTMIELVFVIVVIGIITAVMLPRIDRDNVYEAAQQVISHIKYTQHLAMMDNKFDDTDINIPNPGNGWYQEKWQIAFFACGGYAVYSDENKGGGANRSEAADDPLSRKKIFTNQNGCDENILDHPNVRLRDYYNINNIAVSAGCGGRSIMFDHLGRPYNANNINGVMTQNCDITLNSENNTTGAVIRIVPETGYTYLLNFF
jgi:prepilin-type N-terminal cleavage/methylation domain-containing protein